MRRYLLSLATNLQVHICVSRHQVALVLHAPLQLHQDELSRKIRQERLGVHDVQLHKEWV